MTSVDGVCGIKTGITGVMPVVCERCETWLYDIWY